MAKKIPNTVLEPDCPPVPKGMISVLQFYLARAESGAERFRRMPRDHAREWVEGSELYWTQAAQGIRWVLRDSQRRLRLQRERAG